MIGLNEDSNMIVNEPTLLQSMMDDLDAYRGRLGPGPYWRSSQDETIAWLSRKDLNQFRVYDPVDKTLSKFSGGSLWVMPREEADALQSISRSLLFRMAQKLGIESVSRAFRKKRRSIAMAANIRTLYVDALLALILERDGGGDFQHLRETIVGRPSDTITIDGCLYTPMFLQKFAYYLDLKARMGFGELKSFVEIGPGAGQLDEIVAKLNPECRCFLIDIPPQLYVTQKVMEASFGPAVAGYQEIKDNPDVLRSPQKRIFVLAPWQAEKADIGPIDLFISQIFEEMPPETVLGYLDLAKAWSSKLIHVTTITQKAGHEVTSLEQYRAALADYRMICERMDPHVMMAGESAVDRSPTRVLQLGFARDHR